MLTTTIILLKMKQQVIHPFPNQMLDHNYTRVIYYDSGWKATFIFIILPYLSGSQSTYNFFSWPSAGTPSNVLADNTFRFWRHRWKWEHEPPHHCKTPSAEQAGDDCPSKLEVVVGLTQLQPALTHQITAPCCVLPPQGPGQWKGDPRTKGWYHRSLSTRTRLCLCCSRNHEKNRRSSTLGFCNYDKGALQISSLRYNRLKGFFRSSYWVRWLQWFCKCSDNILLL